MLTQRASAQQLNRFAGGFTLIELLLGLSVGAIVLLALALSWSLVVRDQVYVLSVTALHNDMRSAMQVITQDARRARAPNKMAAGDQFVQIEQGPGGVDESCLVFNAHVGNEGVGPEAPLRFVWIDQGDGQWEGLTWAPSGYRLVTRAGATQLEVWAPPPVAFQSTELPNSLTDEQFQAFGTCSFPTLATPTENNWWTPLIVSGDRGVFIESFRVTPDGSRCLGIRDEDLINEDLEDSALRRRCDPLEHERVESLNLNFELAGRIAGFSADRRFELRDSVKVRNDWVIRTW